MQLRGRFQRSFFEHGCLAAAPSLLGAYLVHRIGPGDERVGRIVEVEAYLGDGSDPSSHSHRGETRRNRAMFGPPGHLYVYRSYGIHICANVVCEAPGRGAALLLRAVEPLAGLAAMRAVRGLRPDAPDRELGNGPGKLCQALDIRLDDYGTSLLHGRLRLRPRQPGDPHPRVARSTRIGISKGRERPYRFFVADHPCVSHGRPS
ncbi:MAG: DNA-3-methyladenine glycosylase [Deltaproteobacteria bacterium]|nr:DNA-3-methyladenine glycosylase [Deltaproteobacteria bacterium]MBW2362347.1 DNA-3-methyladenine glycosylase [Deltaproteobacteria bacterium]